MGGEGGGTGAIRLPGELFRVVSAVSAFIILEMSAAFKEQVKKYVYVYLKT